MRETPTKPLYIEYVTLVALLISITALSTDLMLPAMDAMATELGANNLTDAHFVVTAFFLGMAGGQMIVGPVSDRFGRRPIILLGFGVFLMGCLISTLADTWFAMLAGRVIQGFGAASPRIVTMALVRDRFEGREMARLLSFVMALFIMVPIIAPAIGLVIIKFYTWQAMFIALAALSLISSIWFFLRMPESLPIEDRRALSLGKLIEGLHEVVRSRVSFGYTIIMGLIYGAFIGYLGSAQNIFQKTFFVGDLFVVYFAIAAISLGAASLTNAKLVMHLGMRKLTGIALMAVCVVSFFFLALLYLHNGTLPLSYFLTWLLVAFFFVGLLFGNMNALSLEPLGHMAGLGAAFVGSLSLMLSLPLAWAIGYHYDGTPIALVAGFAVLSLMACGVYYWIGNCRT